MLPELKNSAGTSIGLETYDPNIKKLGPGDVRGEGYIAGIAVGTVEGDRWYFPINHEGGGNLEEKEVLEWAARELCTEGQPVYGANLAYDLGWLLAYGIEVPGPYRDVQIAEPLIDEHARSYALDRLAGKYLGESKDDSGLYQWLADHYGGAPERNKQAGRIHLAPPDVVRDYAISDVDLPIRIFEKQWRIIQEQELEKVFDLESRLLPVLVKMRRKGVRVDVEKAQQVKKELERKEQEAQNRLNELAGRQVNVNAPAQIAKAFDAHGLDYPTTDKGNPSFTKAWLDAHESELADAILRVRKYNKARSTFIDGHILGHQVGGRIHPQFLQLPNDEGGTVSGRLACKIPNLQQIPSRDPELGPMIRGLFLPEPGETWYSLDWSQIEYRVFAHYAKGEGADELRERYQDSDTDFHELASEIIQDVAGKALPRKTVKNCNFLSLYGGGPAKLAETAGVSLGESKQILEGYHSGLPCVRYTFDLVQGVANKRGYIKTYMGRRCRYPLWEPQGYTEDPPLPYEEAFQAYGPKIKRAGARKGLNNLIQGSSADLMKIALVRLYEELGVVCNLTVHDEVDISTADFGLIKEVKRIMEDFNLRVPVAVDVEAGPNWGDLEEVDV